MLGEAESISTEVDGPDSAYLLSVRGVRSYMAQLVARNDDDRMQIGVRFYRRNLARSPNRCCSKRWRSPATCCNRPIPWSRSAGSGGVRFGRLENLRRDLLQIWSESCEIPASLRAVIGESTGSTSAITTTAGTTTMTACGS